MFFFKKTPLYYVDNMFKIVFTNTIQWGTQKKKTSTLKKMTHSLFSDCD